MAESKFEEFKTPNLPQISFYKILYYISNLGIIGFVVFKLIKSGFLPINIQD